MRFTAWTQLPSRWRLQLSPSSSHPNAQRPGKESGGKLGFLSTIDKETG